jgi:hypothetical protein
LEEELEEELEAEELEELDLAQFLLKHRRYHHPCISVYPLQALFPALNLQPHL